MSGLSHVVLFFVWLSLPGGGSPPGGYIPPLEMRSPECGRLGIIVGVVVDRRVNPTAVLFQDPRSPAHHCRQDVRLRVAGLKPGTYEMATTEIGRDAPFGTVFEPHFAIDPHTSLTWVRDASPMGVLPPVTVRILARPE